MPRKERLERNSAAADAKKRARMTETEDLKRLRLLQNKKNAMNLPEQPSLRKAKLAVLKISVHTLNLPEQPSLLKRTLAVLKISVF